MTAAEFLDGATLRYRAIGGRVITATYFRVGPGVDVPYLSLINDVDEPVMQPVMGELRARAWFESVKAHAEVPI